MTWSLFGLEISKFGGFHFGIVNVLLFTQPHRAPWQTPAWWSCYPLISSPFSYRWRFSSRMCSQPRKLHLCGWFSSPRALVALGRRRGRKEHSRIFRSPANHLRLPVCSRVRMLTFKSRLWILAVCPKTNYLTSLILSLLIYQVGILIIPTSWGGCKNKIRYSIYVRQIALCILGTE